MHIADPASSNLGANAIVGGSVAIAAGAALSAKKLGTGQIAVCFFGEGALGQGLLYEAMNLAQLWKLPVLYVCENNLYNEYTHYSETTAGEILARPAAFAIQAESVDGQDVVAVNACAQRLTDRVRKEMAPAFLLCNTYRYRGHHVGDVNRDYYRSKQEEKGWMAERDPIYRLSEVLMGRKLADQPQLDLIRAQVQTEINAGAEFALNAPYPDLNQVNQDVYA